MSALDEIQTLIDQNTRLQRMVDDMADQLEQERIIILEAAEWMQGHWGANMETAPSPLQAVVREARRLRGGQINELA